MITHQDRANLRALTARAQAGLLSRSERTRMDVLAARERRAAEAEAVTAAGNNAVNGRARQRGATPTMPTDEQVQGAIKLLDPSKRPQARKNASKKDTEDVPLSFGDFGDSRSSDDGPERDKVDPGRNESHEGDGDAESVAGPVVVYDDANDTSLTRTLAISNFGDTPVILQVRVSAATIPPTIIPAASVSSPQLVGSITSGGYLI